MPCGGAGGIDSAEAFLLWISALWCFTSARRRVLVPCWVAAIRAMPVVLAPGSVLNAMGWVAPAVRSLSRTTKGRSLATTVLPFRRSSRALAGWQGMRGDLALPITNTRTVPGAFVFGSVTGPVSPHGCGGNGGHCCPLSSRPGTRAASPPWDSLPVSRLPPRSGQGSRGQN